MKTYTKQEIEAKGYDSGVTLAIWFRELPPSLVVPLQCREYAYEYLEALKRGFREKTIKDDQQKRL